MITPNAWSSTALAKNATTASAAAAAIHLSCWRSTPRERRKRLDQRRRRGDRGDASSGDAAELRPSPSSAPSATPSGFSTRG